MTPEQAKALREPFPAALIGKLPKGGTTLDYVGHGAVTHRLLEVDPDWNWAPVAVDDAGRPLFDCTDLGQPVGLWINLTIGGVTRLGYGSVASGVFDARKQLIGDAIRNAAMRFGVALDLWVKGHAEDDERFSTTTGQTPVVAKFQSSGHSPRRDGEYPRGDELSGESSKKQQAYVRGLLTDAKITEPGDIDDYIFGKVGAVVAIDQLSNAQADSLIKSLSRAA